MGAPSGRSWCPVNPVLKCVPHGPGASSACPAPSGGRHGSPSRRNTCARSRLVPPASPGCTAGEGRRPLRAGRPAVRRWTRTRDRAETRLPPQSKAAAGAAGLPAGPHSCTVGAHAAGRRSLECRALTQGPNDSERYDIHSGGRHVSDVSAAPPSRAPSTNGREHAAFLLWQLGGALVATTRREDGDAVPEHRRHRRQLRNPPTPTGKAAVEEDQDLGNLRVLHSPENLGQPYTQIALLSDPGTQGPRRSLPLRRGPRNRTAPRPHPVRAARPGWRGDGAGPRGAHPKS